MRLNNTIWVTVAILCLLLSTTLAEATVECGPYVGGFFSSDSKHYNIQIYRGGECDVSVLALASYNVDTHQYDSTILNPQEIDGDETAIADDMFISLIAGRWLVSYGPLSSDDPTYETEPLPCKAGGCYNSCSLYTDTRSGAVYIEYPSSPDGTLRKIESVSPLKSVGTAKGFDRNKIHKSNLASILQKNKKINHLFSGFDKAQQDFVKQFFASKSRTVYDIDNLKENSHFVVKEKYNKEAKQNMPTVYWRQKNNKLILLGEDWCCSYCEDIGCIGTFDVSPDGEKLFYHLGDNASPSTDSYYIVDAQDRIKYFLGDYPPGPDIR